jgi:hypothetical protein
VVRSILPFFAIVLAISAPAFATEIVPLPHFDSVELRGGGHVTLVPGAIERVILISGSTRFTGVRVERGGQLIIDACKEECPSSYQLQVQVESPRVPDLGVSGGGEISVSNGFAPQRQLSAAVNGGGRIDTRALEASTVSAAVKGGGDLLVRARSMLAGAVKGGGHVRYWGSPQVTTAIQGGGSVQPGY